MHDFNPNVFTLLHNHHKYANIQGEAALTAYLAHVHVIRICNVMQITMLSLQVVSAASSHCCFNTKALLAIPHKDGVLLVHVHVCTLSITFTSSSTLHRIFKGTLLSLKHTASLKNRTSCTLYKYALGVNSPL